MKIDHVIGGRAVRESGSDFEEVRDGNRSKDKRPDDRNNDIDSSVVGPTSHKSENIVQAGSSRENTGGIVSFKMREIFVRGFL